MTASLTTKRRPAVLSARRATGQVAARASMIEVARPFGGVGQQILAACGSLRSTTMPIAPAASAKARI